MIDLGTNREAEVGDIVYAVTTIASATAKTVRLHFGASSQAHLWLNGEALGYVPNEKGVRLNEFSVRMKLKPDRNRLVVKLQRFWERRWMFYAGLTPVPRDRTARFGPLAVPPDKRTCSAADGGGGGERNAGRAA
ncbi:MAG: hypothetical protein GXP31_11985 [Kiritimatiellaeota bacterium]|nr:hypothetical protein [Kiritimatiellota bacterium]